MSQPDHQFRVVLRGYDPADVDRVAERPRRPRDQGGAGGTARCAASCEEAQAEAARRRGARSRTRRSRRHPSSTSVPGSARSSASPRRRPPSCATRPGPSWRRCARTPSRPRWRCVTRPTGTPTSGVATPTWRARGCSPTPVAPRTRSGTPPSGTRPRAVRRRRRSTRSSGPTPPGPRPTSRPPWPSAATGPRPSSRSSRRRPRPSSTRCWPGSPRCATPRTGRRPPPRRTPAGSSRRPRSVPTRWSRRPAATADRVRADSDRELAAASQRRDSINAQLSNVRQMLQTLSGAAVAGPALDAALRQSPTDAPSREAVPEADAGRRAGARLRRVTGRVRRPGGI